MKPTIEISVPLATDRDGLAWAIFRQTTIFNEPRPTSREDCVRIAVLDVQRGCWCRPGTTGAFTPGLAKDVEASYKLLDSLVPELKAG